MPDGNAPNRPFAEDPADMLQPGEVPISQVITEEQHQKNRELLAILQPVSDGQVPMRELTIRERFTYHAPTPYRAECHEKLTEAAITFAQRIDALCRPSRERTLAIDAVAVARMQANAALAIHGAPDTDVKDA